MPSSTTSARRCAGVRAACDLELGFRLAAGVGAYCTIRGLVPEGRGWFRRLLAARQNEYAAAEPLFREAPEIWCGLGDKGGMECWAAFRIPRTSSRTPIFGTQRSLKTLSRLRERLGDHCHAAVPECPPVGPRATRVVRWAVAAGAAADGPPHELVALDVLGQADRPKLGREGLAQRLRLGRGRRQGRGAESISMAFLVLLETLTPLARAVFLLREVFSTTSTARFARPSTTTKRRATRSPVARVRSGPRSGGGSDRR